MKLTKPAPKPPARVVDRRVIKRVRQRSGGCCEWPDHDHPADGEPHHVETVGSGGPDIEENMLHLAKYCHSLAQDSTPGFSKVDQFQVVAGILGRDIEDIIETVERAMGRGIKLWHRGVRVR